MVFVEESCEPLIYRKEYASSSLLTVFLVILSMVSLAGLTLSFITFHKIVTVNKPHMISDSETFTLSPWVEYTLTSPLKRVMCRPGSTDLSGHVEGIITGSGGFMINVHFGQKFPIAPKSVEVVAPYRRFSRTIDSVLWVEDITDRGFIVRGWFRKQIYSFSVTLFYYEIIQ